jgi:hypothetical protein
MGGYAGGGGEMGDAQTMAAVKSVCFDDFHLELLEDGRGIRELGIYQYEVGGATESLPECGCWKSSRMGDEETVEQAEMDEKQADNECYRCKH